MSKMVRWLIGVVVVAAFGTMLWLATRPPPLTIQGEVSADRVDISPRISARIVTLKADVGDVVERGTVMAGLKIALGCKDPFGKRLAAGQPAMTGAPA